MTISNLFPTAGRVVLMLALGCGAINLAGCGAEQKGQTGTVLQETPEQQKESSLTPLDQKPGSPSR